MSVFAMFFGSTIVTLENVTTPLDISTPPKETFNVEIREPVFAQKTGQRGSFHSSIKTETLGRTKLFAWAIAASYWNTLDPNMSRTSNLTVNATPLMTFKGGCFNQRVLSGLPTIGKLSEITKALGFVRPEGNGYMEVRAAFTQEVSDL